MGRPPFTPIRNRLSQGTTGEASRLKNSELGRLLAKSKSEPFRYIKSTSSLPPWRSKTPKLPLPKPPRSTWLAPQAHWLPRSQKVVPHLRFERRHPDRYFQQYLAIRGVRRLKSEVLWKAKYYVFDTEGPALEKIGHATRDDRYQPTMASYVEVMTTPAADTPGGAVLLRFDHRNYFFGNASEGTQRVFSSRGVTMAKIDDIFLTGLIDWHGVGGLLGMVLTMADIRTTRMKDREQKNQTLRAKGKPVKDSTDAGPDFLNIHGGTNLTHMLATARGFVYRNGYPLRPQEVREDPRPDETCEGQHDWEDENIKVWYVPVVATKPTTGQLGSKKRRFDSISADGKETAKTATATATTTTEVPHTTSADTPTSAEEAQYNQELILSVVRGMFTSEGYVQALYEAPHVALGPTQRKYTEKNGEIVPLYGCSHPDQKALVLKQAHVPTLPHTEPARMSLSYVVKPKVQRGKFFPQNARGLGVKVQDFKRLTAGESVVGHGGLTVTPDMVMGPAPEPNGFAVVELPDPSFVEPFLARPEWGDGEIMRGIRAFYWNVRDPAVLKDEGILAFMASHRERGVKHVVLSRQGDISPVVLGSSALQTAKLHMIDSEAFPLLPYTDPPAIQPADSTLPYEHVCPGFNITLAPKLKFSNRVLKSVTFRQDLEQFASGKSEILALAQATRAKTSDPSFLAAVEAADADIPSRDAEIITLGTGSALPSKTRNVSCTLIRVPGIGNYLLDCGENSLGQLRRMYGYAGADGILRDLRAIWISHSHADHHLGVISLLRRYSEVCPANPFPVPGRRPLKQLALFAHPLYHNFVTEYADVEDFGLDTHVEQLVNAGGTGPVHAGFASASLHSDDVLARYGVARLAVCKVDHCADSYALALTLSSGLKVAYSGDCRPSRNFALPEVGGGAHVLIHEATLEDGKRADAVQKKHCTLSEALGVAKQMKARNLLLTHFSQRYPSIPVFDKMGWSLEDGSEGDVPVLVAFDFMRVRLGDFRKAVEFLPALQRMYEDVDEVVEAEEGGDAKEIGGVEGLVLEAKLAGP